MARLHTQSSNWNNSQAPDRVPADLPMSKSPVSSAREINVVTKVVSEYDPNDVTVARTIVQPIAIVPYNTVEQPLYQYESQLHPSQGYMGEQDYDDQSYEESNVRSGGRAKVNALKIVMMLLSLVYIAVVVVGKFVDIAYLKFYADKSGLDIILGVTSVFGKGLGIKEMLFPILLAANGLLVVLVFLASIIGIKKGMSVFVKIIAILSLACIGGFGYLIFDAKLGFGYGFYAVAALTALITVLAIIGKRRYL